MKKKTNFKDKPIAIVTHEFASGFAQYLEDYLKQKKISNLLYVHHPLLSTSENGSGFRFYSKGKLLKEKQKVHVKTGSLISYITNFLQTVFWSIRTRQKWDIYIGCDNLNAFCGWVLKKLGYVNKVIFYTVDFVPNRFSNSLLNSLYLQLDKFCVINCDETWILSPRMTEGRHKYLHLDKKYDQKQILVPEGVWLNRMKRPKINSINVNSAVFVGHLIKKNGVQKVIEAIPLIIKKIPQFKLVVIGKGDYEEKLHNLTKKINVEKYVDFKGFVQSHKDVEDIISRCALGFACYETDKDSFTYYAEPAKTKVYMGAGIPVIMTDMFYNAKDIEIAEAGKIVKYNKESIAEAVILMMSSKKIIQKNRKAAQKFILGYNWEEIFLTNLNRISINSKLR